MTNLMRRGLVPALLLFVVLTGRGQGDEKPAERDVQKLVDLGPLGEWFTLVSAEYPRSEAPAARVLMLRLRAKKSVDTSALRYQVGLFDKTNHLHATAPLQFTLGFPLKEGESIDVQAVPWIRMTAKLGRIAVRKGGNSPPVLPDQPSTRY